MNIPGLPDNPDDQITRLKELAAEMRDRVGDSLHDVVMEAGHRFALSEDTGPWRD